MHWLVSQTLNVIVFPQVIPDWLLFLCVDYITFIHAHMLKNYVLM